MKVEYLNTLLRTRSQGQPEFTLLRTSYEGQPATTPSPADRDSPRGSGQGSADFDSMADVARRFRVYGPPVEVPAISGSELPGPEAQGQADRNTIPQKWGCVQRATKLFHYGGPLNSFYRETAVPLTAVVGLSGIEVPGLSTPSMAKNVWSTCRRRPGPGWRGDSTLVEKVQQAATPGPGQPRPASCAAAAAASTQGDSAAGQVHERPDGGAGSKWLNWLTGPAAWISRCTRRNAGDRVGERRTCEYAGASAVHPPAPTHTGCARPGPPAAAVRALPGSLIYIYIYIYNVVAPGRQRFYSVKGVERQPLSSPNIYIYIYIYIY